LPRQAQDKHSPKENSGQTKKRGVFSQGVLHNFGGNVGMWGDVSSLNSGPFDAFANASSVAGVGMFPEGIDQNSPYYSFLFDVAWCGARATTRTQKETHGFQ
jgi:hypothetical protein